MKRLNPEIKIQKLKITISSNYFKTKLNVYLGITYRINSVEQPAIKKPIRH